MDHNEPPSVLSYLSYREFLRDFYAYKKKLGRGFSYRLFARQAGFSSPNFLKLVIDGKRNLSAEMSASFARACQLEKKEARYFLELVAYEQAKSSAERQAHYERLARERGHQGVGELDREQLQYFSKWYLPAIRELALRPDFRPDAKWIGNELWPRVSERDVREALSVLQRLGLLAFNERGEVSMGDASLLSTPAETRSVLVGGYHREMMRRAAESIDIIPSEERDLSALIMCLGEDGLKRLKHRLREFRRELLELSSLEEEPRQVVQLNFQLFPLSRGTALTKPRAARSQGSSAPTSHEGRDT